MIAVRAILTILAAGAILTLKAQDTIPSEFITGSAYRLFAIAGDSPTISVENIRANIALPGHRIVISRETLDDISRKNNHRNAEFICQFILAHELGHQVQFKYYGERMTTTASCELKRLFECQADLLAGVYISRLYRFYDTVVYAHTEATFMSVALEYVYQLGDEEYSLTAWHPSYSERRLAFRIGVSYGLLDGNFSTDDKAFLRQALDLDTSASLLDWSYEVSKRIIHFPNIVERNIFTGLNSDTLEKYMIWHKNGDYPVVDFISNYYKNSNDFPVKLFIQCKLVGKNRDPKLQDPKYAMEEGRRKNYTFILAPGDSVCIRDSLNWSGLARKKIFPTFLSPPKLETLYNAERLVGESKLDSACPMTQYELGPLKLLKTKPDLDDWMIHDIEMANSSLALNTSELESGFAKRNDEFTEISHEVDMGEKYGGTATITRYLKDNPRSEYMIELYDGASRSKARNIFSNAFKLFHKLQQQDTGFSITTPRPYSHEDHFRLGSSKKKTWIYQKVQDGDILKTWNSTNREVSWEISGTFSKTRNKVTVYYIHYRHDSELKEWIRLEVAPHDD